MEKKSVEKVCKLIYRRFPPMKNKHPKVTDRGNGRYLLVFSGSGKTPDGKELQQTIRVVATEDGRIIKTSMSR